MSEKEEGKCLALLQFLIFLSLFQYFSLKKQTKMGVLFPYTEIIKA